MADHLSDFSDSRESELLHKIRLDVKKIKALLNVAEFSVKGFKGHKHYLPFRTIFRKAGEIRQADVLNELFRIYTIKAQHIIDAKALLVNRELIPTFLNDVPKFLSSIEKKKEGLLGSFKGVNRLSFEKYLQLKEQELKGKVFPQMNQHELHKTRKIIKEILYLSVITKKSKRNLDPFYDKVQGLIGQWHDKQNAMTLLNSKKNSRELKQLKTESRFDIKKIKELIQRFYIK